MSDPTGFREAVGASGHDTQEQVEEDILIMNEIKGKNTDITGVVTGAIDAKMGETIEALEKERREARRT